jgi:AcrR family transcriptional regulator
VRRLSCADERGDDDGVAPQPRQRDRLTPWALAIAATASMNGPSPFHPREPDGRGRAGSRRSCRSPHRILEAATAEFSTFGIAGARVDRIAKTAGCNKNLIYIYFESKEMLFTTVLQKQLARGYEEVAFTPDDLSGYAARVFDFTIAHPELVRLMTWFSLEQKAESPAERVATRGSKIAALVKAQKAGQLGTPFPPRIPPDRGYGARYSLDGGESLSSETR